MRKIAIVGAGPTGIYTFFSLLHHQDPLAVTIYEQAAEAGVGMPYSDEDNGRMMLANIASIEIPPLFATYLDWLREQSDAALARFHIDRDTLHERQFLPRILLGEYFRDQFLQVVERAQRLGFQVTVRESARVSDIRATAEGVSLWTEGSAGEEAFDFAIIATGHVWPDEDKATRFFFPSPWSGLMSAKIPPCRVGIMGTSLSGIDAAMAVAIQHGDFSESADGSLSFTPDPGDERLEIVLMSRSGILPEADFYCPIPYEPLHIASEEAIARAIAEGADGLLDRIFGLLRQELELADPRWSERLALRTLDADRFADAWFAERKRHDPFHWAQANLEEVERNKRLHHTVAWRYTVLRLHEAVQAIVPHLSERDSQRFSQGLARVFIDNYAAIPSQSIRRLLALREAGVIRILPLGEDYELSRSGSRTLITAEGTRHEFAVFIDARGQKPMKIKDLPFPSLREQLLADGEDFPQVGEDYTLLAPPSARGRLAFGALPYLMHDQPFIQGLTACAEIGAAMAQAVRRPATAAPRRWLFADP